MENNNGFKGKVSLVCVYKDKKSNIYSAPLLFDNESCALRHFDNVANNDINASDYDLYVIGRYCDLFGRIDEFNNGDKYLLREGDYYYEQCQKMKDSLTKLVELKEKYREEYRKILNFSKTLYKDIFENYNEESFCLMLDDFEKNYNKDTFKVGDYNVKK